MAFRRRTHEARESAAAIRALRKAGFTDSKIRADHPEHDSGWKLVANATPAATKPRGTGAMQPPRRTPLRPMDS